MFICRDLAVDDVNGEHYEIFCLNLQLLRKKTMEEYFKRTKAMEEYSKRSKIVWSANKETVCGFGVVSFSIM